MKYILRGSIKPPGPDVLNVWLSPILERLDGRKFPAQFGAKEKSIRNLLNGTVNTTRSTPKELALAYVHALPSYLNHGNEKEKRIVADKMVAAAETEGPLTLFFLGQKLAGQDRPKTIELALGIDTLSSALALAKSENEISVFKAALNDSQLLDEDYWRCPATGRDMRSELAHADNWDLIDVVVSRLRHNCIISLVASWDVEFCSTEFDRFELIPLLLQLAPKLKNGLIVKPSNIIAGGSIDLPRGFRGFGDIVDRPMSLLIEITSCLVYRRKHHSWPERQPKVSEMAKILGVTEQKLAKLRSSIDAMTFHQYQLLLRSAELELGNLIPLLVAAHIWDGLLFPKPSLEKPGGKAALIPDAEYFCFWERHRRARESNFQGNTPWPNYWERRSVKDFLPTSPAREELY